MHFLYLSLPSLYDSVLPHVSNINERFYVCWIVKSSIPQRRYPLESNISLPNTSNTCAGNQQERLYWCSLPIPTQSAIFRSIRWRHHCGVKAPSKPTRHDELAEPESRRMIITVARKHSVWNGLQPRRTSTVFHLQHPRIQMQEINIHLCAW